VAAAVRRYTSTVTDADRDRAAFETQVAPFRAELHAHCYRLLGSVHDADDAVQEAMIGAWRGLAGFAGRSSLRSWLYTVATNACLRVAAKRPPRVLSHDRGPSSSGSDVADFVDAPWLEPYPLAHDPAARVEERESIELAFVAALQLLPATQRAVLVLREVMGFAADEVARMLETSVASVNSALQRARETMERRAPARSQQTALRELGDASERALVASYVDAWARQDTDALLALLTRDVRFTMPPIPTWFDGIEDVGRFVRVRMFATPWVLVPMRASGQLAFACYQGPAFHLGALNLVTVRDGLISEMTGFLDPALHARFALPRSPPPSAPIDR
jgi:RNA polymerase sigma-70 factor (TIGR02960 family)